MNHSHSNLILASGSRYRAEMLQRLGIDFQAVPADIDETAREGETGGELARRLALEKAAHVARDNPEALVIGADQVAELDDGGILGKPHEFERALAQLRQMRGREVVYHSAIALLGPDIRRSDVVCTRLRMREFDDAELRRYIESDKPFDCAGSMRSEALGITLVDSMSSDDPTALIGLPLIRISQWLRGAGITLP